MSPSRVTQLFYDHEKRQQGGNGTDRWAISLVMLICNLIFRCRSDYATIFSIRCSLVVSTGFPFGAIPRRDQFQASTDILSLLWMSPPKVPLMFRSSNCRYASVSDCPKFSSRSGLSHHPFGCTPHSLYTRLRILFLCLARDYHAHSFLIWV